ncbi:MAG: helix-turn-helix transcriptional regulator [Flavobacteriales bacterium]|nr:helix-turn-helix transcriptional regulator [Flavobacteriales bacterium]
MIIDTFGEYMRKLREQEGMPLRKLAAALDIDQSTLSKIERNERRPTKDMIPPLASTFNLDENQLMIGFLTDKITYELADEEAGLEALKRAKRQIEYQVKASKQQLLTNKE